MEIFITNPLLSELYSFVTMLVRQRARRAPGLSQSAILQYQSDNFVIADGGGKRFVERSSLR
jgi:hypothetical protein